MPQNFKIFGRGIKKLNNILKDASFLALKSPFLVSNMRIKAHYNLQKWVFLRNARTNNVAKSYETVLFIKIKFKKGVSFVGFPLFKNFSIKGHFYYVSCEYV